jgi:phosphatidylglycerophosphate synthase
MSEYAPTSRRPIAAVFRRTAEAATQVCVHHGIHPDAISYLSIVAAFGAAICFWQSGQARWLLIVAPLFCYLRLWFNMLDGMVAVAAGKASRRGEILNDLPDRISDVIIFVGVAHSGLMNPFIGYWAAIFAVVTAYVGLFGQGLGAQREFGGMMSKPWRMVAEPTLTPASHASVRTTHLTSDILVIAALWAMELRRRRLKGAPSTL